MRGTPLTQASDRYVSGISTTGEPALNALDIAGASPRDRTWRMLAEPRLASALASSALECK